jgi:hypothetical protein
MRSNQAGDQDPDRLLADRDFRVLDLRELVSTVRRSRVWLVFPLIVAIGFGLAALGLEGAATAGVMDGFVILLATLLVEQLVARRSERQQWESRLPSYQGAAREVWAMATETVTATLEDVGLVSSLATGTTDVRHEAATTKKLVGLGEAVVEDLDRARGALDRFRDQAPVAELSSDPGGARGVRAVQLFRETATDTIENLKPRAEFAAANPELWADPTSDSLGSLIDAWEGLWSASRRSWGAPLTSDEELAEINRRFEEGKRRRQPLLAQAKREFEETKQKADRTLRQLGLTEEQIEIHRAAAVKALEESWASGAEDMEISPEKSLEAAILVRGFQGPDRQAAVDRLSKFFLNEAPVDDELS